MARSTAVRQEGGEDVWIPTACDQCYNTCSIRVHRVNGVPTKIEGIPGAQPNHGKICAKGNAAFMNLYNPGRITHPLIRTNPEKGPGVDPKWKRISWDEATDLAVAKLRAAREKDPRGVILASFDQRILWSAATAFLTAFGSPNVTVGGAAFFCGRGFHPVAYTLVGSTDIVPDIEHTDLILMLGTSYGFVSQSNAMGHTTEMARARARGMRLVVVDPVCTYAASQADEWVPIRPGTDGALALSMMQVLVNELGVLDVEYLRSRTNGPYLIGPDGHYVRDPESGKPLVWDERQGRPGAFDAVPPLDAALEGRYRVGSAEVTTGFQLFREHLTAYPPEQVAEITTVPASTIRRLAEDFGRTARVGATIAVAGCQLPYRPAAACWYRGVSAHQHAMHSGLAVGQLNVIVGAVDVPGGMINGLAANPLYRPEADQDGLIVPGGRRHWSPPMPRRKVRSPETLEMFEIFPLAFRSGTMMWLHLANPELGRAFDFPYQAEALIHCRTNVVATGADPAVVVEALKRLRFQVSFATHHDDTTEFADLLLPDAHALERWGGIAYNTLSATAYTSAATPGEEWAFNFQQPVVPPMGESRFWMEVLVEWAHRLGITTEYNQAFNVHAGLTEQYRLEPNRTYTWLELIDRHARSLCGDEHGLEYFRQHGYYTTGQQRSVAHSYPRLLHQARVPLYLEHFLTAGEEVRAFMVGRDIVWDTSDYVPLTEWQPCASYHAPAEYDLFAVNQKLPFLTFSFTSENAWLMDLAARNDKVFPVGIHAETARRKGIADGDRIVLETRAGRTCTGVARLTEGIHPECLAVPGILGRTITTLDRARGQGVHYNSLIDYAYTFERLDKLSSAVDICIRVKLRKTDS